jgi:hypothetical protein
MNGGQTWMRFFIPTEFCQDFIILAENYTKHLNRSVIDTYTGLPVRYFLIIIILFVPLLCNGQMMAPGATSVRYSVYPSRPLVKDPLFFYCSVNGTERGTLDANRPGKTGNFNFTWYQWSNATTSFSILLKTDTGVPSSTIDNLVEGGYKVDIDIAGVGDTSLVCWIFFDQVPVSEASLQQYTCYKVALKGRAEASRTDFYYKDPTTGETVITR